MSEENKKKLVPGRIGLFNVRLSFEAVFKPEYFPGDEKDPEKRPKYKANLLLPKDGSAQGRWYGMENPQLVPALHAIWWAKCACIKAKMPELDVVNNKEHERFVLNIEGDNYCVRDGDKEKWDGYADHDYLTASSYDPPKVVGRDKRKLTAEENLVFSGCWVNAWVNLWHLEGGNKGKFASKPSVYAGLDAIQYVKEGPRFGAPRVDESYFEDLTDESDIIGSETPPVPDNVV